MDKDRARMMTAYDEACRASVMSARERLVFCAGFRMAWEKARDTYRPVLAKADKIGGEGD